MTDEHDNQSAATDGSSQSSEPLTAAQRRAQAKARGESDEPVRKADGKPAGRGWRKKKKKEKKKYDSILGYLWGEWIRPLGQILLIVMTVRLVAFDWFDVPTGSMEPTIMVGDRILVHKWVYGVRVPFSKESWIAKWGTPSSGDIVVCYSPDEGDEVRLVKRLVAQGGDTVELKDGRLIINGEMATYAEAGPSVSKFIDPVEASKFEFLTETTSNNEHSIMLEKADPQSIRNVPPFEVPEDHFVVIGDNRDNSKDSRQWNLEQNEWGTSFGVIHERRVHGRAFAVAFSLDKSNFYMPRLTRTGKPLD